MISVLHPSYRRPVLAAKAANKWITSAIEPFEYILCLAEVDPDIEKYKSLFSGLPVKILYNAAANMVKELNAAAAVSTGDLLVVISDDFDCPHHWDKGLSEGLKGKSDFVVKTEDGIQPFIMTLPIMDRIFYSRFGYIYHPSYKHMFADAELAEVGRLLGKTINLPIMFRHLHYSTGQTKMDETNSRNNSYWAHDEAVYIMRKENNFYL